MKRRKGPARSLSTFIRASVWVAAPLGAVAAMTASMLSVNFTGPFEMASLAMAHAKPVIVAAQSAQNTLGTQDRLATLSTEATARAIPVQMSSAGRCRPAPGFFGTEVDPFSERKPETIREDLVARIHAVGRRLEVVPALGAGIAWTESRFDPDATSPDGLTTGAFQLKRITADAMRRRLATSAFDLSLQDEVTLGIAYLRYLEDLFARPTVLDDDGNTTTMVSDCFERWRFAIAAYNAGEGRVAGAQRRAVEAGLDPTRFDDVRPYLPRITRRYVDSVLQFATAEVSSQAS